MLQTFNYLFIAGIALTAGFFALSGNQESAIDSALFLYTTNEQEATEYVHKIVESGDSEGLTNSMIALEEKLDANQVEFDLLQLENNIQNLTSVTQGLILEQKYSDDYSASDLAEMSAKADELKAECEESGNIASEEETEYTPPESDAVYNEKKKDLLEVSFRVLEKVSGLIDQKGLRASEEDKNSVVADPEPSAEPSSTAEAEQE